MKRVLVLPPKVGDLAPDSEVVVSGNSMRQLIEELRSRERQIADALWDPVDGPLFVFFSNGRLIGVDDPLSRSDTVIHCGRVVYGG